jgi:hypothetical protein
VLQHVAELVQGRQLAAVLEARVDRQQAPVADRRLQEQVPQVLGEDFHRMGFRPLGQLPADLALQAGKDQPCQGVAGTAAEQIGVRVTGGDTLLVQRAVHGLHVALDPDPEHLGPLAAVDGQDAMRGNLADLFPVVEVIAESLVLLLLDAILLLLFLAEPLLRFHLPLPRLLLCPRLRWRCQGFGGRGSGVGGRSNRVGGWIIAGDCLSG